MIGAEGSMHRPRLAALGAIATALLLGTPHAASADITAFLGFSPTTSTRTATGFAIAAGFTVVGFEFEYGTISESAVDRAPSLKTGMANVQLQTPFPIAGLQFYGTAGVGFYSESLGADSNKSVGTNLGGGIKMRLIGPLRLRLDYRLFKLQGSPLVDRYHRLYAGANLSF
jgi:hypothetical protein